VRCSPPWDPRAPSRAEVPDGRPPRPGSLLGLWVAFVAVHAWLTFLGVVVARSAAFYDVDLYRYWMYLALHEGHWPVLDDPSVYPVGAVVPMLLPGLVTTFSTTGYAVAWCAMVAVLDAAAVLVVLPGGPSRRGVWWWLAFLALLGPVAIGRLDAVIVPLMLVGLTLAVRHPRAMGLAAALMTAGAWVKVAPGALLLSLATAARRPWRDVVTPAAAVCVVVVAAVAAGGGWSRLWGFLGTQRGRGLQVESVTATPWLLASPWRDDVVIRLNDQLITYEIAGPGTAAAARVLDVALVVLVACVAAALLVARRRGLGSAVLLPGALTVLTVLIVANKVGSPQFLTWLAAPLVVLLSRGDDREGGPVVNAGGRWLRVAAITALVAAGLTQIVFPWGYLRILGGDPAVTGVLALRNVGLVVLLCAAGTGLLRALRSEPELPARRGAPGRAT
jgi:hypothetical protein